MNAHVFNPEQLDYRLPKTAQVYELLRSAIISLKLQPGETISEKDLCSQLDISRTPLREAILQLANQKLIIIRPNASTVVSPIKLKDVLEGQLVRETLEMRSVKLAARFFDDRHADAFNTSLLRQRSASQRKATDEFYSLDEDFHKIICECSGYPNLWRLLNGAKGQLDRVRRWAFPVQNHFDEVIGEHEKIASAIMSNDEATAEHLMLAHLDSIFETLQILIDERSDFFTEDSIAIKQCKTLEDFRRLVG
ncbi:GntR family transcriptional regulator [Pseudomonas syringae]|uniref:GntR family transcriptional regulator n=1 Tax=Pseudomonas syringae TaxID=317 RepID=UPI000A21C090|nr:GntR family transcriptional regulator [Pseudomonas syringae]OSR65081.1 HTH-type transcriptional repressor RspR [Pseudomonas syringae pv. actinidiae]